MLLSSLCLLMTHLAVEPTRPLPAPVTSGVKQAAPLDQEEPECVVCHVHAMNAPERHFGQPGQWTLGLRNAMQLQGFRISVDEAVTQDVTFSLDATTAYFLPHHISVGGLVGYSRSRPTLRDPAVNSLQVGPQMGYNLPIWPNVSFYPSLALLYGYHSDRDALSPATLRTHTIDLSFDFSFVVALREHLSLSVGPYVKQSAWGHVPPSQFMQASVSEASTVQTYYGLQVGLLGWL